MSRKNICAGKTGLSVLSQAQAPAGSLRELAGRPFSCFTNRNLFDSIYIMLIWKRLRHLLKYRDLFLVFLWRNFSIRYRQAIFGIAWAVLQPLSMMLLFTFIFGYALPMKMSDYPAPIFFYSGLLLWSFFASSLNYSIPILVQNYNLVTKIYFPKEILPLAGIAIAFIDFLIASLIFIGLLVFYKINPSIHALWVLGLLFILVVFSTAVCFFLSSLNVFYRDVQLASNFLIQLWFFITPVFYSVERVPPKLKILLFLNPLTFIFENMRRCVIEARDVVLWQFLFMLVFVLLILHLSYRFFIRTERKFADVI